MSNAYNGIGKQDIATLTSQLAQGSGSYYIAKEGRPLSKPRAREERLEEHKVHDLGSIMNRWATVNGHDSRLLRDSKDTYGRSSATI